MDFPKVSRTSCNHATLRFSPSSHATEAGYHRPTARQRAAAITTRGHSTSKGERDAIEEEDKGGFPAPLVLPGDDLSLDPQYPPQSLRSWVREKDRNEVTPERRIIYVAAPPDVHPDVEFIRAWSQRHGGTASAGEGSITPPRMQDILSYLSAFYCGLPVKQLSAPKLRYTSWDDSPGSSSKKAKPKPKSQTPSYIGLTTSTECIRIRTRPSPSPVYPQQLNLDDLLDAAISILPADAYALLLLVSHDLFEGDDDEFVCGRAYGGSRVAVVSTSRYHPALDDQQGVEREHVWPASHCENYVRSCCAMAPPAAKRSKAAGGKENQVDSTTQDVIDLNTPPPPGTADRETILPIQAAIAAHLALPSLSSSPSVAALSGLWLGRVCKTASHELGHCFGIDHCVYYACIMQGSASLSEDARQPPYLCPVDEAKLARATGVGSEERRGWMVEFCEKGRGDVHLWRSLGAWLRKV